VVIPTMDRYEILKETLPKLCRHGFYEIIVVDSSGPVDAFKNRKLCEKLRVRYYHFVGNREEARNFGVEKARGEWVYIFDDDGNLEEFNWRVFNDVASRSYDFIYRKGCYVWIFRRDFFLKIGGYDPNLCYGDDYDITVRAFKCGKGARITNLTKFGVPVQGSLKMRWKGTLYYGMSMLSFFAKYPTLKHALSVPYRPVFFLKKFFQERTWENLIKFGLTTLGVILSLFYYLKYPPLISLNNA